MIAPSADRVAAVAAVIDGTPAPTLPRVEATNGTGPGETAGRVNGAPARGPGRPPLDASHLSQSPEAIRARRRREQARNGGAQPANDQKPEPSRRSFTPALRRESPPPPPPPRVASTDDIGRATTFVSRLIMGAGLVAAKLLDDERMKVPKNDADEAAQLVLDAWPELAILDADGKKWLAVLYVGSLVGERYGQYQRRAVSQPAAAASDRPPGDPVRVVDPPAANSSMSEIVL